MGIITIRCDWFPLFLFLADFDTLADQSVAAAAAAPAPVAPEVGALAGLGLVSPAAVSANPFASSSDSPVVTAAGPIMPIGDIGAWYRAVCRGSSGVLYEDPNLQVGLRISATGPLASVGIFMGNKAGHTLKRVVCAVPPAPAFSLSLATVPNSIDPGRQIHVQLEATCLAPYTAPPVLQLGYTIQGEGSTAARTLDLPLPVTRFCQPVEVPQSVFTARWAQVAGAPFKLSQAVTMTAGPAEVAGVLSSLHLRMLDGVDPTEGTVCAACVFHCGTPQARQVPCMVKVEGLVVGGGRARASVTVATADAMTTEALKSVLVEQLRA